MGVAGSVRGILLFQTGAQTPYFGWAREELNVPSIITPHGGLCLGSPQTPYSHAVG